MGAWRFMWPVLRDIFGREPSYAGRAESGSPATGSMRVHLDQQAALVDKALGVGS
jgi:2-oxoglutarate dehydrogenase complex dehydrogenase (E1) component-like enzyme